MSTRPAKSAPRCRKELTTYTKRNLTHVSVVQTAHLTQTGEQKKWPKSYSCLCCTNCSLDKNRLKRFVDRDLNAANNILLVGMSLPQRPEQMRRNKPAVGAVGTSIGPTPSTRRGVGGMQMDWYLFGVLYMIMTTRPLGEEYDPQSLKPLVKSQVQE